MHRHAQATKPLQCSCDYIARCASLGKVTYAHEDSSNVHHSIFSATLVRRQSGSPRERLCLDCSSAWQSERTAPAGLSCMFHQYLESLPSGKTHRNQRAKVNNMSIKTSEEDANEGVSRFCSRFPGLGARAPQAPRFGAAGTWKTSRLKSPSHWNGSENSGNFK